VKPIFLSVIIPVYNEEASIERVVLDHAQVLASVQNRLQDWEIVCLDDASTDQTRKVLEGLQSKVPRLRIIYHDMNQGIYQSFTDLAHAARGTHVFQTAADDQWPAENLKRLLEVTEKESCDLVIGVRENRGEVYSLWRQILSWGFNLVPKLLFGIETKDANSIKMGTKAVFTIPLISHSFFGEIERIIETHRSGGRIGYTSIRFVSRPQGKATGANWKNIFSTLRDLFRFIKAKGLGAS